MIIRKPYAFLIKNFKLIHFFMLIFSSYLLYKSKVLLDFFTNYSNTRQVISVSNNYLPILVFIFSLLIIAFSLVAFILLKEKDKPKLLYFLIIVYYVLFIVYAFISKMTIDTILFEGLSPKNARIIRDVSLIVFIVQIIFVLLLLVRTLGFDVKKFHFGEDLQELKIDEADSEEIEITSGLDSDKFLRKLEIIKEDWKVFYLENKTILIIIAFILIVIIPGIFILRYNVENKRYLQNESVDLNSFNLKITNSYITKYNYKGEKILKENNSFLIVKFSITNLGQEKRGINLNNLRIETENNIYSPNITYYQNFIDLGTGYYEQKIDSNSSNEYIALYIINNNSIKDDLIVRYADKLTIKNSEINALYKRIIINPIKLDDMDSKTAINLNEEINFAESFIKNTRFTIYSYGIRENYVYKLGNKDKYLINRGGMILKLAYSFTFDPSIDYFSDFNDFISKYANVVYIYNGKEYKETLQSITPNNYDEEIGYYKVNSNILNASNIRLVFSIRNIKYTYVLK